MEVGGASSIEECWRLVRTQEETHSKFMFLENCCYGKNEMLVRNIVNDGLFGDIIHCHGAYSHDLREEIACGIRILNSSRKCSCSISGFHKRTLENKIIIVYKSSLNV